MDTSTTQETGAGLPALIIHDGQPMADSRDIARVFGKEHRRVLQTIREVHCSDAFRQHHFVPFKNKDLSGESTSHVMLTRNGFAFLVLGFTGPAAAAFKEAYIERFDAMEAELRRPSTPAVPQSLPEALRLAADLAERNAEQAKTIAVLAPKAAALDTLADTEGTFCVRDAAKALDEPEKRFRAYLASNGWIYRRGRQEPWCARAERLTAGLMRTKVVQVETGSGKPWNRPQARITSRGLALLATRLGKPVPAEAQQHLAITTERSA